jgi:predicted DsbA family dithiol-disulfide isomerase
MCKVARQNTGIVMSKPLTIDFVSDVVCPWCAIGLASLTRALQQLGDEVDATIRFHPFELTPDMGSDGEYVVPYLSSKYGISPEQVAASQAQITARGQDVGFVFDFRDDSKKWNTFKAHRLLHWAGLQGEGDQLALKQALLLAYFTHNQNPDDIDLLCDIATQVGLDSAAARTVLESNQYADDVLDAEQHWQQQGISSVPAMIFNGSYLVSGGQPEETLKKVIRDVVRMSEAIN